MLNRINFTSSTAGLLLGLLLAGNTALAFDKGEGPDTLPIPESSITSEPRSSRSFAFDNDVLVPGSRDQDYTYGLNLTFYGEGVEDHLASLHSPLEWLDRKIGINQRIDRAIESSKIEYGLLGFTPETITLDEAQDDDRPYASLVYVSSTRERYQPAGEIAWQSNLTIGALGLDIVGDLQLVGKAARHHYHRPGLKRDGFPAAHLQHTPPCDNVMQSGEFQRSKTEGRTGRSPADHERLDLYH